MEHFVNVGEQLFSTFTNYKTKQNLNLEEIVHKSCETLQYTGNI